MFTLDYWITIWLLNSLNIDDLHLRQNSKLNFVYRAIIEKHLKNQNMSKYRTYQIINTIEFHLEIRNANYKSAKVALDYDKLLLRIVRSFH